MNGIERKLGEILANQENHTGWLKNIDGKLDAHLETTHADPAAVQANTRLRWMVIGICALLSTGIAVAALVL